MRPVSSIEERVNRVRASLNSQLLKNEPSHDPISDESVAAIVAAEARRSNEMAMKLGPRAYLLEHDTNGSSNGHGARRVADTNKTFLSNTLRSVESHNRREQVDSAWRQHGLLKKLDRGELYAHTHHNHDHPRHDTSSSSAGPVRSPDRSSSDGGDVDRASDDDCSTRTYSSRSTDDALVTASNKRVKGRGPVLAPTGTSSSTNINGSTAVPALDPLAQREIWAARKAQARAFSPTVLASTAHDSSSTELGEIKDHKSSRHRPEREAHSPRDGAQKKHSKRDKKERDKEHKHKRKDKHKHKRKHERGSDRDEEKERKHKKSKH